MRSFRGCTGTRPDSAKDRHERTLNYICGGLDPLRSPGFVLGRTGDLETAIG